MDKINPGDQVKDLITGLIGIATARTEWLNRCVRITVQPQELKDGKPIESVCFDEEQLEVLSRSAVTIPPRPQQTGGARPDVRRAPDPTR